MARSTRTVAVKPTAPARKSTTLTRSPAKNAAAATVQAPAAKTMRGVAKSGQSIPAPTRKAAAASAPPKALSAPKPSKDELKAQVEKLERSGVTLRAKSRDMTRAAKASTGRIAELEAEVTRLEEVVTQAQAEAKPTRQPARRTTAPGATKMSRDPDVGVGSALSPDVAPKISPPLDEKAETAPNGLEESLSGNS